MAKLGMVAAARVAGVSRATIHRYAKSGKLSVELRPDGGRVVDTAELGRVFGELQPGETSQKPSQQRPLQPPATSQPDTMGLVAELRRTITRLEADVDALRREIEGERVERGRLLEIVARGQRLLEDKRPAKPSSAPRRRAPRTRTQPTTDAQPTGLVDVLTRWALARSRGN